MKYMVKEIKGKWVILKPDGSHVNEAKWDERKHADKHLEMLLAMKVEDWGIESKQTK